MTSTGVNVLRYSALFAGVFYGISHQATIRSRDKTAAAQREYDHKAGLIQQAKTQWAADHPPPPAEIGGSVVTNPDSPAFDLEKLIQAQRL